MIGNDIIDLELTRVESNWKRKGFMDKIFTQNEQQLIQLSDNQEIMIWNLWSRKEAAYKIYNRETNERALMPRRIECVTISTKNEEILGKSIIDGNIFYTKTIILTNCIYTEAVKNSADFGKIIPVASCDILKDIHGIPYTKLSKNPVSISHHGRFERKIQLYINS